LRPILRGANLSSVNFAVVVFDERIQTDRLDLTVKN
jgi:hypothetical protein